MVYVVCITDIVVSRHDATNGIDTKYNLINVHCFYRDPILSPLPPSP